MTSQIPCHAYLHAQAARNDVSMCRFWMDLEQEVITHPLKLTGIRFKTTNFIINYLNLA